MLFFKIDLKKRDLMWLKKLKNEFYESCEKCVLVMLEKEIFDYICAGVNALKMSKMTFMIQVKRKDYDLSQMKERFESRT